MWRMPEVLVLTHAEVERLLPMAECIELMADALRALSRGEAQQPLRSVFRPPGAAGLLACMPAYRGGPEPVFGLKAIGVFHGNPERGLDAHQGSVLLFDGETGTLRALVNASAITAIRTAAVSAVATRVLAREDAGDLAILGAGVQARSHLEAMALVRPLRRVRVASRRLEHARAFADAQRSLFPVEAVATVEEAVTGADLIVTATSAAEPIVKREWLATGAHLNVVGASIPDRREVDGATMAAARVFVDRRQSAESEAGDYLLAVHEGAIPRGHIRAELGEVLTGVAPGRAAPGEITLFKSLGLAVEDLWSAAHVYHRAQETGAGTRVAFS
jgi:ornithine cyclodeaminase/alanine dehydrogenase-like protein (mu-crystallin family)